MTEFTHRAAFDAADGADVALVRCLASGHVKQMRLLGDAGEGFSLFSAAAPTFFDLAHVFSGAGLAIELPANLLAASHGPLVATTAVEQADLAPHELTLIVDEEAIAELGGNGLIALAHYRDRGFALALDCAPDFPLPYAAAARALFAEIRVPTQAILDASERPNDVWGSRAARRIAAARGAGARLVAVGGVTQHSAVELGFTRWEREIAAREASGDLRPASIGDLARALCPHRI